MLYVGKAKNLKRRVFSYTLVKKLSYRISQMVVTATTLKHQPLDSELEALLTEAELIRNYQPPFNVLLKDDKSPLYIYITDDIFPRVLPMRKKELNMANLKGTLLGPFPSSTKVREVIAIARSIFPWCNNPLLGNSKIQTSSLHSRKEGSKLKPCFYYHLQLCPGACVNKISREEYNENIKQLTLFLKGKKKTVTRLLETQMKEAVAAEKFEKAAELRDKLALISEVTSQRYLLKPETVLPALLNTTDDAIIHLQSLLNQYLLLPMTYPIERIEGFDVSNTSGTLASVSMVTFQSGRADTNEYRLFNIRSLNTPNDFQMMKEAVARRQNHSEWGVPDLVVIDGGKGQLRSALSVWGWDTPVISIAKDPDRLIIPKLNWPVIMKQIPRDYTYLKKLDYAIITLPPNHPTLNLIQQIRDESHRFSKKQHTRRREKKMFE